MKKILSSIAALSIALLASNSFSQDYAIMARYGESRGVQKQQERQRKEQEKQRKKQEKKKKKQEEKKEKQ